LRGNKNGKKDPKKFGEMKLKLLSLHPLLQRSFGALVDEKKSKIKFGNLKTKFYLCTRFRMIEENDLKRK
jgi:hypothetical protein